MLVEAILVLAGAVSGLMAARIGGFGTRYIDGSTNTLLDLALWASAEEMWEFDVLKNRLMRRGRIPGLERISADPPRDLDSFINAVHPLDRDAVATSFRDVIEGRRDHGETEYRVRETGGQWVWLHSRGRVARRCKDGSAMLLVGTTRDITERKGRELRLRYALEGAAEELWEIDTKTGVIRRENPFSELNTPQADIRSTRAEIEKIIHRDDVVAVGRQFSAVLAGQSRVFQAVYRVRRENGAYLWLDSHGQGLDPDSDGRPRRIIGTTRDVSQLKHSEERLRLALWGSRVELWDIDMISGEIVREGQLEHVALDRERLLFRELIEATHPEDGESLRRAMVERKE